MKVPVESLRPGDVVRTPTGQPVTVQRVDEHDGELVVRWWRPARRGEPGHGFPRGNDGRYLGSFAGRPRGSLIEVEREGAA